jgi:hypothetical protein
VNLIWESAPTDGLFGFGIEIPFPSLLALVLVDAAFVTIYPYLQYKNEVK